MRIRNLVDSRSLFALLLGTAFLLSGSDASARPGILADWQDRYGAVSASGDNAGCDLCHGGGISRSEWNAYGWDVRDARGDLTCDLDMDGDITNAEVFFCLESDNSDLDSGAHSNLTEIAVSTQPGWTVGPSNTIYTIFGTIPNQFPPADIGPVDPDGTEPLPPVLPPPPGEEADIPPGQIKRDTIVVKPGQSIQAALDRAEEGTRIYVLAGTYRELSDPVNGLRITKSGIRLIGQSNSQKRVILENAGNQSNGIVVVPPIVEDCMSCHTTMGPPFSLLPGVEPGLPDPEPLLYDIEISGITIKNFSNNGLFTERVDGFKIIDVESIDNPNYGIFPTLSKNGLITQSKAIGSDLDSGIWVETSENVEVTHNLVTGNVNGFEVSNSDDIRLAHNVAHDNTVGMAILLLPDIFDDRPGAKRITIEDNEIYDNNKPNTARPGAILREVPSGTGILHLGVDDSLIARNHIENNKFAGIAIVDYCLIVAFTNFPCDGPMMDPNVTPEFIADQAATNNRIEENVLVNNGTDPDPGDFDFGAADLTYISGTPDSGNCRVDNIFTKLFSLVFQLRPCP
jgi:parallel beta-helix repeat protein